MTPGPWLLGHTIKEDILSQYQFYENYFFKIFLSLSSVLSADLINNVIFQNYYVISI